MRISGQVVQQGIRRTVTNQKLRQPHKDLHIAADIKKKRLEWIGHLVRMLHGWVVQKISESKPGEREWQDLE
jgi:hypothetical protein